MGDGTKPPDLDAPGWKRTDEVGDAFMVLDKRFMEDGTPFRCWVKILIGEHSGWILLGDHCLDNTTRFLVKNLTSNKTMGIPWKFLDEDSFLTPTMFASRSRFDPQTLTVPQDP